MKNALIDIGSNTIRLVVYDGEKEIENIADYAGLIAEVKDNKISSSGVLKIISSLTKMKTVAHRLGCDNIYPFATASLRGVKDSQELVSVVKEACGLEIEIISGEQEAEYDFIGLKAINNVQSGLAFDLGGGSCQIMVFDDNGVIESKSLLIGSLKLKTMFVSHELPSKSESDKISSYVSNCLNDFSGYGLYKHKKAYAMGGAVFALCSIAGACFGCNSQELTQKELEKIAELSYDQIYSLVPKRADTIVPAAITMLEILNHFSAEVIVPTPAGVREGILYKNLLK